MPAYSQNREVPMDTKELLKEAQLLLVDGKDAESVEAFTKAIEAGADRYISHLSRGVVYVKLKEVDKALDDFNKAINANGQSARGYFYKGLVQMMKANFADAVKDFSCAIELKPIYHMAIFARGVSHARLGNFKEASKDILKVTPQMEQSLQSFSDSYGILRTEMGKVMSQFSEESNYPEMQLNEKDFNTLKKWLEHKEDT
jgi:tetratricopeptide (TPR) repeat protein